MKNWIHFYQGTLRAVVMSALHFFNNSSLLRRTRAPKGPTQNDRLARYSTCHVMTTYFILLFSQNEKKRNASTRVETVGLDTTGRVRLNACPFTTNKANSSRKLAPGSGSPHSTHMPTDFLLQTLFSPSLPFLLSWEFVVIPPQSFSFLRFPEA